MLLKKANLRQLFFKMNSRLTFPLDSINWGIWHVYVKITSSVSKVRARERTHNILPLLRDIKFQEFQNCFSMNFSLNTMWTLKSFPNCIIKSRADWNKKINESYFSKIKIFTGLIFVWPSRIMKLFYFSNSFHFKLIHSGIISSTWILLTLIWNLFCL